MRIIEVYLDLFHSPTVITDVERYYSTDSTLEVFAKNDNYRYHYQFQLNKISGFIHKECNDTIS